MTGSDQHPERFTNCCSPERDENHACNVQPPSRKLQTSADESEIVHAECGEPNLSPQTDNGSGSILLRGLHGVITLPGLLLIGMVRVYQWTLSPIIGRQCRFHPTCSHYFIGCVRKNGAIIGTCRGIWRILRCNPFCKGGYDPP